MFVILPVVIASRIILLTVAKILRTLRIIFTSRLTAVFTIHIPFVIGILIALMILVSLLSLLHILLLTIEIIAGLSFFSDISLFCFRPLSLIILRAVIPVLVVLFWSLFIFTDVLAVIFPSLHSRLFSRAMSISIFFFRRICLIQYTLCLIIYTRKIRCLYIMFSQSFNNIAGRYAQLLCHFIYSFRHLVAPFFIACITSSIALANPRSVNNTTTF